MREFYDRNYDLVAIALVIGVFLLWALFQEVMVVR